MQSSKPAQAGIIVAANYTKNTVCWPIIVPFRQTRCVITCQVLNINTVLVKYFRITMQIPRTHWGVLPYVGYNTLTLGARGFSCAVSGFGILGNFRRTRFLLTRLTAPGSPTPRMPFPLSREKREPLVPSALGQYSSHLLKH